MTESAISGRNPARAGSTPKLFVSLQALRGVAAFMVVLFHAQFILFDHLPKQPERFTFLTVGDAGVELFFVLSGFILVLAHWADLRRPERLIRFAWKRFARIYPLYWVILAGLLLSQIALNRLEAAAQSFWGLAEAVLLLPVDGSAILTVAWTLSHELLFYCFLGLMIWRFKFGLIAIFAWQAGCIAHYLFGFDLGHYVQFILSPLNILFGFGMTMALVYQRLSAGQAQVAVLCGLGVFIASAAGELARPDLLAQTHHSILYGIGSAFVIAGLAQREALEALRIPGFMRFLGDASYSIYLAHSPAMVFCMILAVKFDLTSALSLPILFLLMVAGGVLAGILCHLLFERPLLKISSRYTPKL